ncbi:hypothetical protein Pint_09589 [Pistacia integerrima]|uniref:Uncharacterized protein n=1 Tax=Pistacia integerrima TaxID=434235 RepID=A0ACC0XF81_9ROSI|nr:hypothetical protein Pint_09589 [Pistacia integerrima]
MSETFRSKKGGGWNILDSFNWVNKKHQDENQKISRVKKQPNEEEKKGDQAEDDKLEGTEKEKKLEGQSSSQEPTPTTPPEKEPEGDKDEENDKDKKPEEAEGLEEDKDNNINPGDLNITWGNDPRYWKPLDKR